jgi:hypothetical protein
MAYIKSQLRNGGRPIRLSPTKFIRFLVYATNDTAAEVVAAGYFNEARADLSVGSIIDALKRQCHGCQHYRYLTRSGRTEHMTVAGILWPRFSFFGRWS